MEEYGIRWNGDDRCYVVVRWDNPLNPVTGSVVYKTKRESDAEVWIQKKLAEVDKKHIK